MRSRAELVILAFLAAVVVRLMQRTEQPRAFPAGLAGPGVADTAYLPLSTAFPEATPELLRMGQETFRGYCSGCHGTEGDGRSVTYLHDEPGWKSPLRDARRYKYGASPNNIFEIVVNGKVDTPMSGWSEVLSGEELVAVTLYVVSLQEQGRSR